MSNQPLVTVFTATYNRGNSLGGVYECLCRQSFKDFEWIVVDDGSNDGTGNLVKSWAEQQRICIRYFYQDNNGKHIAMNKALEEARGCYFVNIDSDDVMRDNALERFVSAWDAIPQAQRESFVSVKARCYDPDTGIDVGKPIPGGTMVTTFLDAKYKHKLDFETWSMARTEIRRQYPNPDIRGGKNGGGLRFYPEGIWQDLAARKYKILLLDESLRGYTQNTSTSLMGRGRKYDRSPENIHLWTHMVNDDLDYFVCAPNTFVKAIIGVSMDGFLLGKSIGETLSLVHGVGKKLLVLLAMPAGYLLYLKRR